MRIWISGGGTGGHVYPAITVLGASGSEAHEVTWYGRESGLEAELVRRAAIPYRPIATAPLVGAGLRGPFHLLHLLKGILQVWRAMGRRRPDVVFVTGGYVAVPLATAAWLRRVPLLVYLPDAQPGKAVRLLARLADRVAVTAATARGALPAGKVVVTGYPVRPPIRLAERGQSRRRLGVAPEETVLLVFGGSQGARRLNRAVVEIADRLLGEARVIHLTGELDHQEVVQARRRLSAHLADRWLVYPYLDDRDMAAALAAADLAVSRAGAATLGEFPARGLPAIVVPLPAAAGHQAENARLLATAGAARVVPDAELNGERLLAEVLPLLHNPRRLAAMAEAARSLDRPQAASAIWQLVTALATGAGEEVAP